MQKSQYSKKAIANDNVSKKQLKHAQNNKYLEGITKYSLQFIILLPLIFVSQLSEFRHCAISELPLFKCKKSCPKYNFSISSCWFLKQWDNTSGVVNAKSTS